MCYLAICIASAKLESLENLDLSFNEISTIDNYQLHLFEYNITCNLKYLNIEGNPFNENGIRLISDFLLNNRLKELKSFNISCIYIYIYNYYYYFIYSVL